jgi:hypothetical protein
MWPFITGDLKEVTTWAVLIVDWIYEMGSKRNLWLVFMASVKYLFYYYPGISKTTAKLYWKQQNLPFSLSFHIVFYVSYGLYWYRLLYMNQIPGDRYLYTRRIKKHIIRIPLLYSKCNDYSLQCNHG